MTISFAKHAVTITLLLIGKILFSQVPDGGIQLNATTGTTHQNIGVGQLSVVSVEDQPFTTALRLVVGANINNAWDSQIQFRAVEGIATNDVLLVAFYARTISSVQETGEGKLIATIENKSTYDKVIYQTVNIGQEWKQYYAPVVSNATLSASEVIYSFHTGFRSQTIEVADIKFLNYQQTLTIEDLPETEITYFGQAPDAEWRIEAEQRINQIRKGEMEIQIFDELGQPIKNADVSIEMIQHQFGFGSAIPAQRFMTNITFREKVYELFNEVVFENDLKWPGFNPNSTYNIRSTMDSLDKHNIALRGHNVIWPAWRWLPSSLEELANNPTALRVEIDKHIDEITQFTSGRLNDWDVINEPYSEHDVMDILGNEVMADWFKRVRQNDRAVKLYLNDYAILSGGGTNEVKQDFYYNLVQYIDSLGGEVQGIGLQGHFGSDLTSIPKIYSILDKFAGLEKDIKITEHDINITQREVQAEYTRDFMTICFSHPAVKSVMFWGFWENSHWMPDAALFNADWSIRLHGQMYIDMVFDQWWTPITQVITDESGRTYFEGFLGTYQYTVTDGENERTGTFTLNHSYQSEMPNSLIISLDDALPVQVKITSSKPAILCEGESVTLNAPIGDGLTYQWFNEDVLLDASTDSLETTQEGIYTVVVSKGEMEVASAPFEVVVNPYPEAKITADGELSFCPGGQVTLNANVADNITYTWYKGISRINGSVTSIDVNTSGTFKVVTNAKGCATESEPVVVTLYSASNPECSTGINELQDGWKVYPNPFEGSFVFETYPMNSRNLKVELFDLTGKVVYSTLVLPSSAKTIIPVQNPGMYTLRISGKEGTKFFKLLGK